MISNERGYFPRDFVAQIMSKAENPIPPGQRINLMSPGLQRKVARLSALGAIALHDDGMNYVPLFRRVLPQRRDGTPGEVVTVVYMGDPRIRQQVEEFYRLMDSWGRREETTELIDQIDQFVKTI